MKRTDPEAQQNGLSRSVAAMMGLLLGALGTACGPADSSGRISRAELRGSPLAHPLERPDVALLDTEGRPFSFREETAGYLTLLFFGYTHCPDVCPVHMANLAAVLHDLPYSDRRRIRVVFVTVDPDRDTPERLREWLDRYDPSFVGLRGDTALVRRVQTELGLPPAIRQPAGGAGTRAYDVGHAAQLIVFPPDGPARYAYPFGTRQADWAHDLPLLLSDTLPPNGS